MNQRSFISHEVCWKLPQSPSMDAQVTSSILMDSSFQRKEDVAELIRELVPPPPPDLSQYTSEEESDSDDNSSETTEEYSQPQLFHRRPTEIDLLEKLKRHCSPKETVKNLEDYIIYFIEQGKCASWKDVVQAILCTMERHDRNLRVQLKAFDCFYYIMKHRKSHIQWFNKCLHQILKAMKAFRNYESIQRCGVKLIQKDGVLLEYRDKLDIACLIFNALCDLPTVGDFIILLKNVVSLLSLDERLKVKGYDKFVSMLVEFPKRPFILIPSIWAALEILYLLANSGTEWEVFYKVGGHEKLCKLSLRPEFEDRCKAILGSLKQPRMESNQGQSFPTPVHSFQPIIPGTVHAQHATHFHSTHQPCAGTMLEKNNTRTSLPASIIGLVVPDKSGYNQHQNNMHCYNGAFTGHVNQDTSQCKTFHVASATQSSLRRKKNHRVRISDSVQVINARDRNDWDDLAPLDALLTLRPATPPLRAVQDDLSDNDLQFSDEESLQPSDQETSPIKKSLPLTDCSPPTTPQSPSYSPSCALPQSPLLSLQTASCEIDIEQQSCDLNGNEGKQLTDGRVTKSNSDDSDLIDRSVFLPSPFVSSKLVEWKQCTGKEKAEKKESIANKEEVDEKKCAPPLKVDGECSSKLVSYEKLQKIEIELMSGKQEVLSTKQLNQKQYDGGSEQNVRNVSIFEYINHNQLETNSQISRLFYPAECRVNEKSIVVANDTNNLSGGEDIVSSIDLKMVQETIKKEVLEKEPDELKQSIQVPCKSESCASPIQQRSVLADVSNNSDVDCASEQQFGPVLVPFKIKIPLNLKGNSISASLKREMPIENENRSDKRMKMDDADFFQNRSKEVDGAPAIPIANFDADLRKNKPNTPAIPNLKRELPSFNILKSENLGTCHNLKTGHLDCKNVLDSITETSTLARTSVKHEESKGNCVAKDSKHYMQGENKHSNVFQQVRHPVSRDKTMCWICEEPSIEKELKELLPCLLLNAKEIWIRIKQHLCNQHRPSC